MPGPSGISIAYTSQTYNALLHYGLMYKIGQKCWLHLLPDSYNDSYETSSHESNLAHVMTN